MTLSGSVLLCALATLGCGDDSSEESTDSPETGASSGESSGTDASDGEPSVSDPSGSSSIDGDAGQTTDGLSDCVAVDEACRGYADSEEEAFAELCLRVAAQADAEQCTAIHDNCVRYCSGEELPEPSIAAENACDALGNYCHSADHGVGLENLCHETGHRENAAWCVGLFDACSNVCDGLSELGDAGAVEHHEGGAPTSDAGGPTEAVVLSFRAVVGEEEFACGEQYSAQGTPPTTVTPQDLRFYVSDVRLVDEDGAEFPVTLDEAAPYQGGGVALLDFEDGSGACLNGDEETNHVVTGTAPVGNYVGVVFSTSVPFELNHGDPTTLPAPLQAGYMTWGWLMGYKFLVAEVRQVVVVEAGAIPAPSDGGPALVPEANGFGALHVGSTGCANDFGPDGGVDRYSPPATQCEKPSRNEVRLANFVPDEGTIVVDVGALFAESDLTAMTMCHGSGAACSELYERVGLDFETGAPLPEQTVFRSE